MSRVRCAVAASDHLQKEILYLPWPLTSVQIVTLLAKATAGCVTAKSKSSQDKLFGKIRDEIPCPRCRGTGNCPTCGGFAVIEAGGKGENLYQLRCGRGPGTRQEPAAAVSGKQATTTERTPPPKCRAG
jgi:hypothetical protein